MTAGNWQCSLLDHNTNRLRYFISEVFTWSFTVRFSSSETPLNLTVETLVRIESRILMSIAFSLVWDYRIRSLTDVERKSVGITPVINTSQFLIHSAMNIVNVIVWCKNCCIVSKMNKTHLIWGSQHVIDIQKKKYWAQHRALWNTHCNVWHRGTAIFDWDVLFPVTQIWLKPVLHDISDAIMHILLINMLWLTVSNAFKKI